MSLPSPRINNSGSLSTTVYSTDLAEGRDLADQHTVPRGGAVP